MGIQWSIYPERTIKAHIELALGTVKTLQGFDEGLYVIAKM